MASAIHQRNPLGPSARRARWIGCDILLSEIAADGRIDLIKCGEVTPASAARQRFQHLQGLRDKLNGGNSESRGWQLDVLACVRRLDKPEFTLTDLYRFTPHLKALHLNNNNVEAKIRQQLQDLRDAGLLEFVNRGHYRLT